jgi:hypothetical protein
VCKHPDNIITNIIIPFQEFYLIKRKNIGFSSLKNRCTTITYFILIVTKKLGAASPTHTDVRVFLVFVSINTQDFAGEPSFFLKNAHF